MRIPVYAVGPEAYHRDEAFKQQVLAHYEASLNAMVDLAAEAKAGLLFVTPVSNLRDFAPFKSENRTGLTSEAAPAMEDGLRERPGPRPEQPSRRGDRAVRRGAGHR